MQSAVQPLARRIKVVVIEDHHEIREGMSLLISQSSDFECIGFSNAEDALKNIIASQPDVILMDINLPRMDGITCTQVIKQKFPSILIMMCTVYEDDEKIFKALAAGANGYILKRAAGNNLLESIQDLINGGAPMSSSIARKVVDSFMRIKQPSPESLLLTERENQVLDLLAKGYRNKEIADQFLVSVNTIRSHIYNIYEKLHVQNRVEALNKTGRGSA